LLVDGGGVLVAARSQLEIAPGDVGRLLQDLEISYRPLDLRSLIERSRANGFGFRSVVRCWQPRPWAAAGNRRASS
jgi:hypothetical protein